MIVRGYRYVARVSDRVDGGESTQLKAPSRVRDLTTGELRYRWTETGALDHYLHAHAFDHLVGHNFVAPKVSII